MTSTTAARNRSALTRYRAMAYLTGCVLLIGTFVALPLRYLADQGGLGRVVWTAHGWLYVIYVITALDLGVRRRWPLMRIVLVALAGTIPFASFVAEHKLAARERAAIDAQEQAAEVAPSV